MIFLISLASSVKYPLTTRQSRIVDQDGSRVRLGCVNWYGAHLERYVVDGLDKQQIKYIIQKIKDVGLNCVRLVYSLDIIYLNPVVNNSALSKNTELFGKTALEIFDFVVGKLAEAGLMVILNNHVSTAGWCCSATDGEGLWWTKKYNQSKWIEHLTFFAQRYKDQNMVIGFDLRNQIRKTPQHTPTWGTGQKLTDWHRAATFGGNSVLRVKAGYLIFVEGINYGGDLVPVLVRPIELSHQKQLVYSGHIYSWSWGWNWDRIVYQQFKDTLQATQTFVRSELVRRPYWLGQFGTNSKQKFWDFLMRFLRQEELDFGYWALNGYQGDPSKDESFGLLDHQWKQYRYQWMVADLRALLLKVIE